MASNRQTARQEPQPAHRGVSTWGRMSWCRAILPARSASPTPRLASAPWKPRCGWGRTGVQRQPGPRRGQRPRPGRTARPGHRQAPRAADRPGPDRRPPRRAARSVGADNPWPGPVSRWRATAVQTPGGDREGVEAEGAAAAAGSGQRRRPPPGPSRGRPRGRGRVGPAAPSSAQRRWPPGRVAKPRRPTRSRQARPEVGRGPARRRESGRSAAGRRRLPRRRHSPALACPGQLRRANISETVTKRTPRPPGAASRGPGPGRRPWGWPMPRAKPERGPHCTSTVQVGRDRSRVLVVVVQEDPVAAGGHPGLARPRVGHRAGRVRLSTKSRSRSPQNVHQASMVAGSLVAALPMWLFTPVNVGQGRPGPRPGARRCRPGPCPP